MYSALHNDDEIPITASRLKINEKHAWSSRMIFWGYRVFLLVWFVGDSIEALPQSKAYHQTHSNNLRNGSKNMKRRLEESENHQLWDNFGECIEGTVNEAELGQSLSITSDGKLLLVGSSNSVFLYEYDRMEGWTRIVDFLELLDNSSVGPYVVSISNDGMRLGIGSSKSSMQGFNSGSVQLFEQGNDKRTWIQVGRLLTGNKANDQFGHSLDLTETGSKVMIGAYGGNYVEIFEYQQHRSLWVLINVMNGRENEAFGYSVAISGDGTRGIVGAPFAKSNTGFARIYDVTTFKFSHQIDGDINGAEYGFAVAMSQDGSVAALGAPLAGHVFVSTYDENKNSWGKLGYRINFDDESFGNSLALSEDGTMIAIGAPLNQYFGPMAGRTYMFEYVGNDVLADWSQIGGDVFYGSSTLDACGTSIAFSSNSKRLAVACPGADGKGLDSGRVCLYRSPVTGDDDDFIIPSTIPSSLPSIIKSAKPSNTPSISPTKYPIFSPTLKPTLSPTTSPFKPLKRDDPIIQNSSQSNSQIFTEISTETIDGTNSPVNKEIVIDNNSDATNPTLDPKVSTDSNSLTNPHSSTDIFTASSGLPHIDGTIYTASSGLPHIDGTIFTDSSGLPHIDPEIVSGSSGSPPVDGEILTGGSGSPPVDGEILTGGSGSPPVDGGILTGGSGSPPVDSGILTGGSGSPPVDGGILTGSSGSSPVDGSILTDSSGSQTSKEENSNEDLSYIAGNNSRDELNTFYGPLVSFLSSLLSLAATLIANVNHI